MRFKSTVFRFLNKPSEPIGTLTPVPIFRWGIAGARSNDAFSFRLITEVCQLKFNNQQRKPQYCSMLYPVRTSNFWVFLWITITCNTAAVQCLRWTKEPPYPLETMEGTTATLEWDYDLEGATFRKLLWTDADSSKSIAEWDDLSGKPFIFKDFRPRFSVDKNKRATLIISNLTKTDSGRYSCQLEGDKGGDRQQVASLITLRVVVRSIRWTKAPSDPTEAVEGMTASLDWDYDLEGAMFRELEWTDPDSSKKIAEWDRSSEPYIFRDFRPRFSVDKNKRATLVISRVNRTDSGRYGCQLEGDKGGDRTQIASLVTLWVVVPPQIMLPPIDIAANEEESVTFFCQASGDPRPNITWTRNGKNVGSGVNLTIQDTKKRDAGVYTCTAHNSKVAPSASASAHLSVNYLDAPELSMSGNVTFIIGKSLTLQCSATGYPAPQVYWRDNKGNRQDGKLFTKERADKNGEGTYGCFAKNRLGERSVSVFVTAVEPSKEQYRYRINFVIENIRYNEKYGQADSEEYRNLSNRIRPLLQVFYNNRDITILKFSQGSVKVLFEVIYEKRVDESVVLAPLKQAVKDGVLGDGLAVDPSSVELASGSFGADSCLLKPCAHGTCEEQGSGYKCSCDSVWKGVNCDNPVVIIVLAVVIPVLVVVLAFVLCFWHKRNKKYRRDCRAVRTNEIGRNTTREIDGNLVCEYEIPLQKPPQEKGSANYAELNLGQRSYENLDADTAQSSSDAYASLNPDTRSWEVHRKNVHVEKVIGKGAFGQVAKATATALPGKPGRTVVAVKMLKENALGLEKQDLLSELKLMKTLKRHPHVIELLGCVSEPILVLIEYVPYGDLLGYLRRSRGLNDTYYKDPDIKPRTTLTPQQLMKFAWQIADGMSFLSMNKIVHRDLAARNVLVGEGENCKVTDFGMARDIHQEDIYQKTSKGRLPVKWTAFEALMYGVYTTKSDVWSYGVVLFEVFTIGGCPYPRKDGRKIAELLQSGYRMPKPDHLDDELYQIMRSCWQENPDKRPTFETLKNVFNEMEEAHERLVNMAKYDKKLYENLDDHFG